MTDNNKTSVHNDTLPLTEHLKNMLNVFNQVSDAIYITDPERRILFWNRASEETTGYKAAEILGRRCADNILAHIDMAGNSLCETDLCPLHQAMKTGTASDRPLVVKALHKNGGRIIVEVSVAPIRDDQGQVIGGIEIFREITGKIELEEQKARFFSSLSHELKTPLANIQGYLDLLLAEDAGKLEPLQQDFLKTIYNQQEILHDVIDDLLEMGKFESTDFTYQKTIFDFSGLLKKVALIYENAAASKNLRFAVTITPGLFVLGDQDRLGQAFSNLLSNAVKYTEAGEIALEADYLAEKDLVRAVIKDTGIGIPKKEQKFIFELFYRVMNPSTLKAGGTGIGLYIVAQIIGRHEGKIELQSKPGKGSTFTVYLPGTLKTDNSSKGAVR